MADITNEEAEALDELWTKTTPKLKPNGTGFVSRRNARLMGLDDLSVDYLLTKSEATKKSPAEIISALIRKELAAAV
ncbi:MAG: hypothetical protein Ta2A_14000 [Treponemataceae bacterium]|nr:MAG: hypothetical protein Ta2A_14000 [Treponemataceae bacterium]